MVAKAKRKRRVSAAAKPLEIRLNQAGYGEIAALVWNEMQIQELSYEEVAQRAGCSAQTVSKLVNQDHVRFRACWVGTIIGCLQAVGYKVQATK